MNLKSYLILSSLILVLLFSCKYKEKSPASGEHQDISPAIIARDIIYDVEIKNPSDDYPWMDEALKGLERERLIDFIFYGVYDKNLKAYDIFNGSRISARKIRQMEEEGEFSRDQIGKIQFTEHWMYDSINHVMTKKVTSISLGIQHFDPEGYLRGYDPLFKVILP